MSNAISYMTMKNPTCIAAMGYHTEPQSCPMGNFWACFGSPKLSKLPMARRTLLARSISGIHENSKALREDYLLRIHGDLDIYMRIVNFSQDQWKTVERDKLRSLLRPTEACRPTKFAICLAP